MPVKRRTSQARHLEPYRLWQLIEGPDVPRRPGVGYLAPFDALTFEQLEPFQQQEVLAQMHADWAVSGAGVMAWWHTGEPFRGVPPWICPMHGNPDTLPWAAVEFGEP